MSSASRDDTERGGSHAVTTSPATRSVTVTGNRVDSRDVFSGDREIIIAHGEDTYRLRLTSQNKLILTK
ncbi:MAG TPA: hemin uptake protein HemP [Bradyrhizobium sp.]|jgi:hemin uptake protein HemP|nr:hemin uptake protein HemP [Bradyrhizobium sp.]